MAKGRFHIIFEKLAQLQEDDAQPSPDDREVSNGELEEISELRRIALELTEEEPGYNTTT